MSIVYLDAADGGADTPGYKTPGFYFFPNHELFCTLIMPCLMFDYTYEIMTVALESIDKYGGV